jgi:HK97 family phage major capsid protein
MKKNKLRNFAIELTSTDIDNEFSFTVSSEAPVERYDYVEVLSHDENAIDLTRFLNHANLLFNHNHDEYIGVITNAQIIERKLVITAKISDSKVLQDVKDGILRNVSIGYIINNYRTEIKDGVSYVIATEWQPYEASIVTIPADISVGFRNQEFSNETETFDELTNNQIVEEISSQEVEQQNELQDIQSEIVEASQVENEIINNGKEEEAVTTNATDEVDATTATVEETKENITVEIIDTVERNNNFKKETQMKIGLTNQEAKKFSIMKVLRMLADPHNQALREDAAFELECSRAVAKLKGKEATGIYVPLDVLNSRALDTSTGAGLITEMDTGDFIDTLKNSLVLTQAGARVLNGLSGIVPIPKKSANSTGYWVEEGVNITKSNMSAGQVTLTPRTVGAATEITRALMKQSSYDVEALVYQDLASTIAQAIEVAALNGSGVDAIPTGLLNLAGIHTVELGTDGGALTWADVVAMESMIADGVSGNMSYILNRKTSGVTKVTQKGSGIGFIQEGGSINGYNALVTNNMPSNLTKGTGTGLSGAVFGDFSNLMIGLWGGIDLTVDPYTSSLNGGLIVTALQDCDIAVRNTGAFTRIKDIITD